MTEASALAPEQCTEAAPYDADLGFVEITTLSDKDRKRWAKADNWGEWRAFPENGTTECHEVVYMLRLGQRVRFVAWGGRQYGAEHPTVVAATYWAFAHGWRDPEVSEWHNALCITEVWRGGAEPLDLPLGKDGVTVLSAGMDT